MALLGMKHDDSDDSDMIIIKGWAFTGKSVNANSFADWEIDVNVAGYVPLGVVRWAIYAQTEIVTIYTTINNVTTGRLRVKNLSSQNISNVSGDITVLYKKAN